MKHFRYLSFALAFLSAPVSAQDPEALNYYRTGYDLMKKRNYRNAAIELEKAVSADSTYGDAHYVLAQAYKVLNEYDKAIHGFEMARTLGVKSDRASQELSQLYHKAAINSFGQKKFRKAIDLFESALSANPQNAKAHYAMGLCYNGLREGDRAREAFEKAVAINPKYTKAHKALGDIQRRNRNYGPAAATYQRAIDADPKYMDAYGGLARVNFATGDYQAIVEVMQQALKMDERYPDGHLFLGSALSRLGRQHEAIEPLRRASELDSKNCEARFRLGEAYYGMGDYRQAIEAGQKATRCQRNYHAAEVLLGDAYLKLVQLEDARTWFGRAVADSRFKDYATHQLEEIDRLSSGQR